MTLLIAKTKVVSAFKGNTYANEMDILMLIEVRCHVGLYYNLMTKNTFPCNVRLTKQIDSRMYFKPEESLDKPKSKSKSKTKNQAQLGLFNLTKI